MVFIINQGLCSKLPPYRDNIVYERTLIFYFVTVSPFVILKKRSRKKKRKPENTGHFERIIRHEMDYVTNMVLLCSQSILSRGG